MRILRSRVPRPGHSTCSSSNGRKLALTWVDRPVEDLIIAGNLKGTFYLDDIRLVPKEAPTNTAVVESRQDNAPADFQLNQNFPNPFNSGTVISFALPQAEAVDLAVYNITGQKVATLVSGQRPTGGYQIHWDGRDDQQRPLASGLYLYRLQAGDRVHARKLLLLR